MNEVSDKRQAILSAAQTIFSQKGLKDSTITEIAQKAGVVDSIIYHYFKNKEDLLFCALIENMNGSYEDLMFHFQGILGPISKLGKMVWRHLYSNDYNTDHARVTKALLLECRSNKNFYQHEAFKAFQRYTKVLQDIIVQGIETDYFRKDINAALVREMIFGVIDEVSLSRLSAGEDRQSTADFEAIMAIILAMIENKPAAAAEPENGDKAARVLKAATGVFALKGFNKATMVDVGQAAGVAEGTIYEYFKNKQDLLLTIPVERFEFYRQSLEASIECEGPVAQLRNLIRLHFCILLSEPEFLIVFLNDIKLNKQFYVSEAYRSYRRYVQPLCRILDEGKRRGVFRPEVDNRIYGHLFVGSFTHMAMRWFLRGKVTPLGMMTEFAQMTELLCRAVTP